LGDADLPCNRGGIRNHPKKSMVTSGVRLGSPALREVREALHHL
jgi:glycine/serine hydroxymethyltransferase